MTTHVPSRIKIRDERTWPADVLAYLKTERRIFWSRENRRDGCNDSGVNGADYDRVHDELWEVLCRHTLHGYVAEGS
jgi:hypothetical protein